MLHRPPTQDVLWSPVPGTAPSVPVRAIGPPVVLGSFVAGFVYFVILILLRLVENRHALSRGWMLGVWRVAASFPLVATIPAGLLGLLIAWALWKPEVREKQLGGPLVWQGQQAVKRARSLSSRHGLRLHPSLKLPLREVCRHVLVSGSVGSGKTQIIEPMVESIVAHKARCLILDLKGDFTSHLNTAILSPWDARSLYWDVSADVRTREESSAFADALIPLSHGDSRFWDSSCRQILSGCVVALNNTFPNAWSWQDLADTLHQPVGVLLSTLKQHAPHAVALLSEDPDSKSTQSTLASLATHTRVIDDLARAWGSEYRKSHKGFSVRRWAEHRSYPFPQVCLQAGKDESLSRSFLGAVVSIATLNLLALPDNPNRGIFVVLDELTAIGKVNLAPLFERGRSKGICVIAGFQDFAQVEEVYGKHFATALPAMVGTQIICQIGPGETRDKVAGWCASQRWAIPALSHGADGKPGTLSVHEESRHSVMASELTSELGPRQTKHGFTVRSLVLRGGDILLLEWQGQQRPAIRPPRVDAEWTKPKA